MACARDLPTAMDLAGTFVFAIEGAMIAVETGLDPLGTIVPAFATGLGGGIIRDVLHGATLDGPGRGTPHQAMPGLSTVHRALDPG